MTRFVELPEDAAFLRAVLLVHLRDVLEKVQPLAHFILAVGPADLGCKFSQFYEKEHDFFGKNSVAVVLEHDLPEELLPIAGGEVIGIVVEDVEGIDGRDVIDALALDGILADEPADVGDGAVGEEVLSCALHLDDEVLVVLVAAVDVEDDLLLGLGESVMGGGEIGDVCDGADILRDAGVEEMDEEILVLLVAEDTVEAEVGERVEIERFFFYHGCSI